MNMPDDPQPEEGTYPDPSGNYRPVPKELIKAFIKKGILKLPLTPEADLGLKFLAEAWKYEDTPRLILRSVRKRDRKTLLENIDLSKRDRYIINTINNKDGKKYSTNQLKRMTSFFLRTSVTNAEISSLRKKAYYIEKKKKNDQPL